MPFYEFEGKRPSIDRDTFVHPDAVLMGDKALMSRRTVSFTRFPIKRQSSIPKPTSDTVVSCTVVRSAPTSWSVWAASLLTGSRLIHTA